MSKIQELAGFSQDRQRLFFNSNQLEYGCTLAHYNIQEGSTLDLTLVGRRQMYVKTLTGTLLFIYSCQRP
jgi:ubiquitin C